LDDALDSWKGLSATERAMASYSAEDRADFQARHNTGSEQRHRYEDGFHTDSATHQTNQLSYRRFLAYSAIAVGVAFVPIAVWQLGSLLMMRFTALLVAILLHVVSEPLQRWTPLPLWLDLMIAGLVILGCWRSPDGFLAPV
jgi:Flp pilus assembly protein TadB